jgi:uncharacterized SAM-binding protein YcdF (DUF218 family)
LTAKRYRKSWKVIAVMPLGNLLVAAHVIMKWSMDRA